MKSTSESQIRELDDGRVDYGANSICAILAAVLAIPSLLALSSPVFALFGIVAVVLAVVALVSIARSEELIRGRKIALVALAIGTFMTALAVTHVITRRYGIYKQAQAVTQEWLDNIRDGKLDEAYQARVPEGERKPFKMSFDEYYRMFEQHAYRVQSFAAGSPLRELAQFGRKGDLRFIRTVGMKTENLDEFITQRYTYSFEDAGQRHTLPITVVVVRQYYASTKNCIWELKSAEVDKPE